MIFSLYSLKAFSAVSVTATWTKNAFLDSQVGGWDLRYVSSFANNLCDGAMSTTFSPPATHTDHYRSTLWSCATHSRCSRSEGLPHAALQPKNLASSWSELARPVEARLQKPVSFGVLERLVRCQIYFMIQKFKQVWGILCVGYRSSYFLQVIIMLTCHRG